MLAWQGGSIQQLDDYRANTFATSDFLQNNVKSNVAQSGLSTMPHTHRSILAILSRWIDLPKKQSKSPKSKSVDVFEDLYVVVIEYNEVLFDLSLPPATWHMTIKFRLWLQQPPSWPGQVSMNQVLDRIYRIKTSSHLKRRFHHID